MDLLKTLLLYMTMIFVSGVQNAPEATPTPRYTPEPTAVVTAVPTATPTPVPTVQVSPNPEYKTVRFGDNGDDVRKLQAKLAEYGYYAGDTDGRFGYQTRTAVIEFQQAHGLSADGIAGRMTLSVLYDSNEVRPAGSTYVSPELPETPEPAVLAPALTPAPVDTPAPSETPEPTDAPALADIPETVDEGMPTASPAAEPECTVPVSAGYYRFTNAAFEGTDTSAVPVPKEFDGVAYLPLLDLLEKAGIKAFHTYEGDSDNYAFAADNDRYIQLKLEKKGDSSLAYSVLEGYTDTVVQSGAAVNENGTVWFPVELLVSALNWQVETCEEYMMITTGITK